VGRSRAGVVGTEGVTDVVLDERVGGPSVEREVRVSSRVEGTAVGDGSKDCLEYVNLTIYLVLTVQILASNRFRQRRLEMLSSR